MYIFLDVDGVLNKKSDWDRPFSLNSECVANFNDLIRKLKKPKIVLSSTWRNGIARDGSRAAYIEDLMKQLSEAGIQTIDRTATAPDGSRSKEIDFYLRRHESDTHMILDDDSQIFEEGSKTKNLYLVDCNKGLTKDDVKLILRKFR